MTAKNISLRIEALLCSVNQSMYQKSDEILLNPYEEIVSALQYRVPQEKLDKFRLFYKAISGRNLQELIDNNYDVKQLLSDLQKVLDNKGVNNNEKAY